MKTAYMVRHLPTTPTGATQYLYQLSDQELSSTGYVVASTVIIPEMGILETFLFESSPEGNILDWGELGGVGRGHAEAATVLEMMGYEVVSQEVFLTGFTAIPMPAKLKEQPRILETQYVVDPDPEDDQ